MNKPIVNHTFETTAGTDPTKEDLKKELTREQYHKGLIGKVPKKWHKEILEEFDKDMLSDKIMQMPELETETQDNSKNEATHKRLNIHTFMAHENEVCLGGTDENGEELCIWFDSYEFIEWIDKDHIKEKLTKYIKQI